MHTHTHVHTRCLSLPHAPAHRLRHTSPSAQNLHRAQTPAEEKTIKGLLPGGAWGGEGRRARHVGAGCQLSFLRSVLCFGTNPLALRNLPRHDTRGPSLAADSAGTDEPLPGPREDPSPCSLSHVTFPSAWRLLLALAPCPALGVVGVEASWVGACVGFKPAAQKSGFSWGRGRGWAEVCDPGAGTQGGFALLPGSVAQAIL